MHVVFNSATLMSFSLNSLHFVPDFPAPGDLKPDNVLLKSTSSSPDSLLATSAGRSDTLVTVQGYVAKVCPVRQYRRVLRSRGWTQQLQEHVGVAVSHFHTFTRKIHNGDVLSTTLSHVVVSCCDM
jgi:hypothetical protein